MNGLNKIKKNKMAQEIKLWLTVVFLSWAFKICPDKKFKILFANFLNKNILDLK